jgi:hypothetical protein
MKIEQKIKGCFFSRKAIPDTLEEFISLYWNYSIYQEFIDYDLRKKEMENDFRLLNTEIEVYQIPKVKYVSKKK